MSSSALEDFDYRMREANRLIDTALGTLNPDEAATHAKCAVVLAAAALERYMNDVLAEACTQFAETDWESLSEGRERYLLRHMALEMVSRAGVFVDKTAPLPSDCGKLKKFITACGAALDDPSTWAYFREFGLFGEGTNAPDRIDGVLKAFDVQGRSFCDYIEDTGNDRRRILSGLTQLVDARHAVGHAIPGAQPPGPTDCREWLTCAEVIAALVDMFLGYEVVAVEPD